jgi:ABC-2 type transport system ATP-binding protein
MEMEYAIETEELSKSYEKDRALSNINIQIKPGTIFGLAGPNGAGKTTLVRLLSGVLNPSRGSAKILGYDSVEERDEIRKLIGVMPEGTPVYKRLTGEEMLRLFGKLYDLEGKKLQERIRTVAEEVKIVEYIDRQAGGYSHGMKRRLLLARALLHEPQVLLLDEPTLGVDPLGSRKIRELLIELSRKKKEITILVTSHDMFMMDLMCDEVCIINRGKKIVVGTPAELKRIVRKAQGVKKVSMEDVYASYVRE